MAILNPYKSISWQGVIRVPSCSHEHCAIRDFPNLFAGGLKHLAISNYHPSEPMYPLSDYITVPEGVIGSPNSEFYNMEIPYFHANALGSFASEPEPNTKESWKTKFRKILAQMQYEDGGGITLNHPCWTKAYAEEQGQGASKLRNSDLLSMLDFDDRVLGIEFYNAGSPDNTADMWDLDTWDYILSTGRRCWGFCVADHDGQSRDDAYVWRGRNILLVSDFTEHECLKAYREGRFYGSIYDTSLRFDSIEYAGGILSVSCTDADYINIVVDGSYTRIDGNVATFNIPAAAGFVRVEAHNAENSIFSQPIMFKLTARDNHIARNLLLLEI